MSAPQRLVEIWYSAEAAVGENAETLASNTWQKRIPALSCTPNFGQERIVDPGYRSRMNEESISNPGIRVQGLEFETYMPGHFTTCVGALTETFVQDLLSDGLGGGNVAAVGTTLSGATTASSFTLTATTGWLAGMIGALGNKTEQRGNGQCFVVNAIGPPTTSLVALPGTPNAADQVYAMQQAYHDESVASTLGTKRFMIGFSSTPTAGAQYQLLGAQLAGFKITIPFDGQLPRILWRWLGTYWGRLAATIPSSSLTLEPHYTAPAAGGSLNIADVGTSTRSVEAVGAEMELDVDLGLEPNTGPGGVGTYQNIVSWQRTMCKPTLTVKLPWKTAYETWFDTANQSFVNKHILFTSCGIDGRRFAFYMPNCFPVGNRPSFPTPVNNQNYVPVTFRGVDAASGTELQKSAIRFAMG